MLALALSVALLHQDEPVRLRTICKNGAAIIVERMPDEPTISVQLWASARSVPETAQNHGWRHLLEHIAAQGPKGDVDVKLESNGSFLRARTFRDAMQFEVVVGPRQLDLAIATLSNVLREIEANQARIDRELSIMKQEFATYDDASRLSAGAWKQAYGESGLDPFGTIESISKATPAALKTLQRNQFYSENLVVSIAGPVSLKEATDKANELVGQKQGAVRGADSERPQGKPGRIETDGFGEGRAAMVGSYDKPLTVGALAFALAIANEFDGAFVTYTPSIRNGLVIVGQTERQSGVGLRIDEVGASDLPRLFAIGKLLAHNWLAQYMRSATGVAYIRGLLLCQSPGSKPESMQAALEQLTYARFVEASQLFAKDKAVTVVGS